MKTKLLQRLHPADRRFGSPAGLVRKGFEMSLADFARRAGDPPPPLVCPTIDFIQREIRRVGASEGELRAVLAFVESEAALEPRAYTVLSKRMRRLADLLALAGPMAKEDLYAEMPDPFAGGLK